MALADQREPFSWLCSVREALAVYPDDQRYLVGVSGGLDSRVLLELLLRLGFSKLIVCHLNHNLRGSASRGDAEFVERQAKRLKLPCFSKTIKAWRPGWRGTVFLVRQLGNLGRTMYSSPITPTTSLRPFSSIFFAAPVHWETRRLK
jgi:PP-loop family